MWWCFNRWPVVPTVRHWRGRWRRHCHCGSGWSRDLGCLIGRSRLGGGGGSGRTCRGWCYVCFYRLRPQTRCQHSVQPVTVLLTRLPQQRLLWRRTISGSVLLSKSNKGSVGEISASLSALLIIDIQDAAEWLKCKIRGGGTSHSGLGPWQWSCAFG